MSHTTAKNSSQQARRASLPLVTGDAALGTPYRNNIGHLHSVDSPDVSVNAPRIERAEFPLTSSEDPFFPIRKTSSTSAQCSSSSADIAADRSITKDKCTVEVVERAFARRSSVSDQSHGDMQNGSESSEYNPTNGSESPEHSQQRRFDTTSYQQRAEALEGLLEFSARLLQQERFEELSVLLKPFGPEKVSPRETAIWLAKSFKETAA